jgi:hypothetical protein
MTRTTQTLCLAGLLAIGAQVLGNEASTSSSVSTTATNKQQAMHDCMAKQKANNTGMTENAMQTVCRNQLHKNRQQKSGNDLASGPTAETTANPRPPLQPPQ